MGPTKLAAFDIETAKLLPPDDTDWQDHRPLGIACAAVAFSDRDEVWKWWTQPKLSQGKCQSLVRELQDIVLSGYTLATWNGCKFDFDVLSEEAGLHGECAELAMIHVDLMLMVSFTKGHFLSLEKALTGAGLRGKLKGGVLSDGRVLSCPVQDVVTQLWVMGETDLVLDYLTQDVRCLLQLAEWVQRNQRIQWTSNKGRFWVVPFERLLSVQACHALPKPDTSWMTDPPTRGQFTDWIWAREDWGGGDYSLEQSFFPECDHDGWEAEKGGREDFKWLPAESSHHEMSGLTPSAVGDRRQRPHADVPVPEEAGMHDDGGVMECSCCICRGEPNLDPLFCAAFEDPGQPWGDEPDWDAGGHEGVRAALPDGSRALAALGVLMAAEEGVFWPGGDAVFADLDQRTSPGTSASVGGRIRRLLGF